MNPVYTCTVKDDTRWRIVSAYFPFVVSVFNLLQPFSDTFILSRSLWIVSHIVSSRLFNNTIQGIKRCVLWCCSKIISDGVVWWNGVNVTTLVSIIFMYQQVFSSSYRSSTVICTYNLIIFHLLKNDTLFIHLYCTYSKFGHVVA